MGATRKSDVRDFNQSSQGLILQSDIVRAGPTPGVLVGIVPGNSLWHFSQVGD
jgi:hypothetical protein